MLVLGLDEIQLFLKENCDQFDTEQLNALVFELRHKNWANQESLQCDFPTLKMDELPKVRFLVATNTIFVDCIIGFDNQLLLIEKCKKNGVLDNSDQEAA